MDAAKLKERAAELRNSKGNVSIQAGELAELVATSTADGGKLADVCALFASEPRKPLVIMAEVFCRLVDGLPGSPAPKPAPKTTPTPDGK